MNAQTRFIGRPIEVAFDIAPALEKVPPCPNRFTWNDETFEIVELLSEWKDFGRRGRMAQNMQPEHLRMARQRGSWGVGRFFFRIRTAGGRIFELYYDRSPKGTGRRKGSWFLYTEILTPRR